MTLPATANFNGVNGTDINSLSDWDGCNDNSATGNGLEIQSNAAQGIANNRAQANWWTSDSFDNAQYSQATVTAVASGTFVGVGVRMSGTDGGSNLTGYLFYSDSADACYIDLYSGGAFVDSIAGPGAVFAVNDVIRLEISGNNLAGKVNGVTRLSVTVGVIASGAAGVCAYSNGASRVDNWEGGNAVNNYTLALDAGSYTITGQNPTLQAARTLALDAGSYAITGQDATLQVARVLGLDDGSYAITGNDVTLTVSRQLSLDAGSYVITGNDTGLVATRLLALDAGSYTITGQAVNLDYSAAVYGAVVGLTNSALYIVEVTDVGLYEVALGDSVLQAVALEDALL